MKTVLHEQPRETLEEFADKHGLVMEVTERTRDMRDLGRPRYYARFQNSDTKEGHPLRGEVSSIFFAKLISSGSVGAAAQ